jgi:spore coat polysaccharide biosynthesis protein SpsF
MAEAVMRRLRRISADDYVLASDRDGIAALGGTARACGFSAFAGPKDDVLARYAQAAAHFEASIIVRATGDNPLVSYELGNALLNRFIGADADYAGYTGMPSGMGVELIRASALMKAHHEAATAYDREHVCPYLYTNPALFALDRPLCPPSHRLEGASLTVDTPADYERIVRIASELGCSPREGLPRDAELIAWLKREADHAPDGQGTRP